MARCGLTDVPSCLGRTLSACWPYATVMQLAASSGNINMISRASQQLLGISIMFNLKSRF